MEVSKASVTVGFISPLADSHNGEKVLKGSLGAQGLCWHGELLSSKAEIPASYRTFVKPVPHLLGTARAWALVVSAVF